MHAHHWLEVQKTQQFRSVVFASATEFPPWRLPTFSSKPGRSCGMAQVDPRYLTMRPDTLTRFSKVRSPPICLVGREHGRTVPLADLAHGGFTRPSSQSHRHLPPVPEGWLW